MAENTTAVSCDELVKEFSKGTLVWYNFKPDCDILYLYNDKEDAAVKEFLQQKGTVTLCSGIELAEAKLEVNRYDYSWYRCYRRMSESSRIAESMPQDVKAVRKNCAWYREPLCN